MKCQREGCEEPADTLVTDVLPGGEKIDSHLCQRHADELLAQSGLSAGRAAKGYLADQLPVAAVQPLIRWAVTSLGSLKAEEVVPPLVALLKDRNPTVRWAAAVALARVGRGSAGAAAGLREALQDADGEVREAAAWALGRIDPGVGGTPAGK
jgi:hypothetical protein